MPTIKITGVGAYIAPAGRTVPRPYSRGDLVEVTDETAADLVKSSVAVYVESTDAAQEGGEGASERPLSKQNVEELKATAAERGVDLSDATTRADILAKIQAAEQEGGEGA